MHREDDRIFFNETDKRNYPSLEDKDSLPIEDIPDLFQDILDAQHANMTTIHRINTRDVHKRSYEECRVDLQQLHLESVRLEEVAVRLGEVAGTEIIAAMLPVAS